MITVNNCDYFESKVSMNENAKIIALTNSCNKSINTFRYDTIDETLKNYISLAISPIDAGNPKVTFRVDMFNEDNFYNVGIKGSWDNWNSITVLHVDNGYYIGIKEVAPNNSYEYKYVKLDSNIEITQWEDIPSAECTVGEYKNRFVNVSNNNIDIKTVYFNSCNSCTTTLIDKTERDNLIIFPNPNSGIFSVTSNNIKFIEVFNILGEKVPVELNIGYSKSIVHLNKYEHGIFYVSDKICNFTISHILIL